MHLFCYLGWHKWKFDLVSREEPSIDGDPDGSNTYLGTCCRCGTSDIFWGPYDADQPIAVGLTKPEGDGV